MSIYEKTIIHKNSQKVSVGSLRGLLHITSDIAPVSLTFHAMNR